MKARILLTAILSLFLFTGSALAENGSWYTDWDKASAASKKSGKPILVDFTGSDWCHWCIKLKEEVFDTSAFQTWAKENVVLLEIDFPRGTPQSKDIKAKNTALAKKYQVQGFPTVIFANADGDTLGRYGYDKGGPSNWTKKASSFLK